MNENNNTIKLAAFEAGLIEAMRSVVDNENAINRINFFPVSDKDTGTNLSTTLEMLIADYTVSESYAECLDKVSEIVFDNARGNSGILFSIWLSGMNQHTCLKNEVAPTEFVKFFEAANKALLHHLGNFMPGTMVSFLQAFVDDLDSALRQNEQLEEKLEWVRHQLKQHLQQTMEDNPVLRPHGVVDSGALGVYFFVSTLISHLTDEVDTEALSTERLLSNDALLAKHEEHQTHHHAQAPDPRYCTEAKLIIDNDKLDEAKAIITAYGDCDLFLKRGNKLRFHVHCNQPKKLFGELMQIAQVKSPKVEDMLRQYQATTFKRKIALVTDTSADIPESLVEKYHVHFIPLSIFVGHHEALDGIGIDSDALYKTLKQSDITASTATPKMGYVKRMLDFLKSTHDHVFAITLSSNMSGTFDAVKKAAGDDSRVTLFDSKSTAGSQGWLVAKAGEMIGNGESVETIHKALLQYRSSPQIYAAVDSVSSMVASGRVSALKGRILQAVNLKPIISISKEGKGVIYDKAFSRHASLKKLLSIVLQKHNKTPVKRYSVLHVNEHELAKSFAEQLQEMLAFPPVFIKPISTVIGLHIGPGAVVVSID